MQRYQDFDSHTVTLTCNSQLVKPMHSWLKDYCKLKVSITHACTLATTCRSMAVLYIAMYMQSLENNYW